MRQKPGRAPAHENVHAGCALAAARGEEAKAKPPLPSSRFGERARPHWRGRGACTAPMAAAATPPNIQAELADVFAIYDKNGSHSLSMKELNVMMNKYLGKHRT